MHIFELKSYTKIGGDIMIREEVKTVLNGEYNNPKLDAYMGDVLLHSILTCDMSAYMNLIALRKGVICDRYVKIQEHDTEAGLRL